VEKKVYEKKSEKVIDFLIGFFGIPLGLSLAAGIINATGRYIRLEYNFIAIVNVVVFLMGLGYSIYVARKRKFIGRGLLFVFVVVPLVLLGTCLLNMGGGRILGQLFKR